MSLLTQQIAELSEGGTAVPEGTFTFPLLVGLPSVPETVAEVLQRRGVDGSGVRIISVAPEPFMLQTTGYMASYSAAKDAIADYQSMVGKPYGVKLTKDSVDWGHFDVLSVKEAEPLHVVNVKVAGYSGGARVRQTCVWTLIYRDPPEEPEEP